MKVSYKIGAIKLSGGVAQHAKATEKHVATNGVSLATPVVTKEIEVPAKNFSFEMEQSEMTFECEVGELAGVYKELMPMVQSLIGAFTELSKLNNKPEKENETKAS